MKNYIGTELRGVISFPHSRIRTHIHSALLGRESTNFDTAFTVLNRLTRSLLNRKSPISGIKTRRDSQHFKLFICVVGVAQLKDA